MLNTAVNEEVAEALAHSNEFLDLQLLIGLQSSRPFDHGVSVSVTKLVRVRPSPSPSPNPYPNP